jgi:hypothetical protein
MKYKPTKFPMTEAAIQAQKWGWAIGLGVVEFAIAANDAQRGAETWCCGNSRCGAALVMRTGRLPKVCSSCGGEVDWVGIKTRIIRVCPRCNYQGTSSEKYCPWDTPPALLRDKEVPT